MQILASNKAYVKQYPLPIYFIFFTEQKPYLFQFTVGHMDLAILGYYDNNYNTIKNRNPFWDR